jgi:predicted DNA binding CopG/RHH family protein
MNNTIPDPAAPIGNVTIVKDFLPPPEELIPKPKTVQITMEFTAESIEFFKREAQFHNVSYQVMIRNIIDAYVRQEQLNFSSK